MWLFLLLGAIAASALVASYAKKIPPAIHYSDTLRSNTRYYLIVRNMQPGAAPLPWMAAWALILQGFSDPQNESPVDGGPAADNMTYHFHFVHLGRDGETFTWDSPYSLTDEGGNMGPGPLI